MGNQTDEVVSYELHIDDSADAKVKINRIFESAAQEASKTLTSQITKAAQQATIRSTPGAPLPTGPGADPSFSQKVATPPAAPAMKLDRVELLLEDILREQESCCSELNNKLATIISTVEITNHNLASAQSYLDAIHINVQQVISSGIGGAGAGGTLSGRDLFGVELRLGSLNQSVSIGSDLIVRGLDTIESYVRNIYTQMTGQSPPPTPPGTPPTPTPAPPRPGGGGGGAGGNALGAINSRLQTAAIASLSYAGSPGQAIGSLGTAVGGPVGVAMAAIGALGGAAIGASESLAGFGRYTAQASNEFELFELELKMRLAQELGPALLKITHEFEKLIAAIEPLIVMLVELVSEILPPLFTALETFVKMIELSVASMEKFATWIELKTGSEFPKLFTTNPVVTAENAALQGAAESATGQISQAAQGGMTIQKLQEWMAFQFRDKGLMGTGFGALSNAVTPDIQKQINDLITKAGAEPDKAHQQEDLNKAINLINDAVAKYTKDSLGLTFKSNEQLKADYNAASKKYDQIIAELGDINKTTETMLQQMMKDATPLVGFLNELNRELHGGKLPNYTQGAPLVMPHGFAIIPNASNVVLDPVTRKPKPNFIAPFNPVGQGSGNPVQQRIQQYMGQPASASGLPRPDQAAINTKLTDSITITPAEDDRIFDELMLLRQDMVRQINGLNDARWLRLAYARQTSRPYSQA